MKKGISRKIFIKNIGLFGAGTFFGGAIISSCGGNENKQAPPTEESIGPCSDLTGLSKEELQTRGQYNYVAQSPHQDKVCANCNLFILPKEGEQCGECQIVKGPIAAGAYCDQWIIKAGVRS